MKLEMVQVTTVTQAQEFYRTLADGYLVDAIAGYAHWNRIYLVHRGGSYRSDAADLYCSTQGALSKTTRSCSQVPRAIAYLKFTGQMPVETRHLLNETG